MPNKISKYNSKVYIYDCKLCGKKYKLENGISNIDTHHIIEQEKFIDNKNNIKEHILKNDKNKSNNIMQIMS